MGAERRTARRTVPEPLETAFAGVPITVLDSEAYKRCRMPARALLMELVRQHNGRNNGHLHLAREYLRRRGMSSPDVTHRATKQLQDLGLIVMTKQGGLSIGPSLFAVTWLKVSDFRGLEMAPSEYPRGKWASLNRVEIGKLVRDQHRSGPESIQSKSGPHTSTSNASTAAVPTQAHIAQVPSMSPVHNAFSATAYGMQTVTAPQSQGEVP